MSPWDELAERAEVLFGVVRSSAASAADGKTPR